jgi:hypothetical protein
VQHDDGRAWWPERMVVSPRGPSPTRALALG